MSHPTGLGIDFDPTIRIDGRAIAPYTLSARVSDDPYARFRKHFTDRLGLPANATNAQVYAAIDAVKAATPTAAVEPEDAVYASIFGAAKPDTAKPQATPEDALYASIFGA